MVVDVRKHTYSAHYVKNKGLTYIGLGGTGVRKGMRQAGTRSNRSIGCRDRIAHIHITFDLGRKQSGDERLLNSGFLWAPYLEDSRMVVKGSP